MTATQIIHAAYQRTKKPLRYNTRNAAGESITTNPEFSDPRNDARFIGDASGKCVICGGEVTGGFEKGSFFPDTYMDYGTHKEPSEKYVCEACAWCLMLNAQSNRTALYRFSFCAAEELTICNRGEIRDVLYNPPFPPFVLVVSVSQKKHIATKAKVSYSREKYVCMLEEEPIPVTLQVFREEIDFIEALRGIGATKEEIESSAFRFERYKEFGEERTKEFTSRITGYRRERMFTLALFVAQKKDEEESRCILGLKQTT